MSTLPTAAFIICVAAPWSGEIPSIAQVVVMGLGLIFGFFFEVFSIAIKSPSIAANLTKGAESATGKT